MNKRPAAATIIGWLLVAVGATGFAFHLNEIKPQHALHEENAWILVVELAVIVCSTFVLRGQELGTLACVGMDRLPCGVQLLRLFGPRGDPWPVSCCCLPMFSFVPTQTLISPTGADGRLDSTPRLLKS